MDYGAAIGRSKDVWLRIALWSRRTPLPSSPRSTTASKPNPRTLKQLQNLPRTPLMNSLPPTQLTASLAPTHLAISNDSAAHRHHAPMRESGGGNGETHFTVQVVSAEFEGKVRLSLSPPSSLSHFLLLEMRFRVPGLKQD